MNVSLRPLEDRDLDTIYQQVTDPESVRMAAFTAEDQTDRASADLLDRIEPRPLRPACRSGRSQLGLALFRGECGFGGAQPRRA